MYRRTNNMPAGLAAYHEKRRAEKMENMEYEDQDELPNAQIYNEKVNKQQPKQILNKLPINKQPINNGRKKIDNNLINNKLNEAKLELFMNQERQKELKRLITKLNKEL